MLGSNGLYGAALGCNGLYLALLGSAFLTASTFASALAYFHHAHVRIRINAQYAGATSTRHLVASCVVTPSLLPPPLPPSLLLPPPPVT